MALDSVALKQVIVAVVTWFVLGGGILYYVTYKSKPSNTKPPKKLQNKKLHKKKGKQTGLTKIAKKRQTHTKRRKSGSIQISAHQRKNSSNLKPKIKKSKSTDNVNKLNTKTDNDQTQSIIKSQSTDSAINSLIDIVETKQECDTEEKYMKADMKQYNNMIPHKTVNIQILKQLETINNKFDGLIGAINAINNTLQSKQNQHVKQQVIHNESTVDNLKKCIEMLQFILLLPIRLLFNIKTVSLSVLIIGFIIYLYRNELDNKLGINIDIIGQRVINYYIFPHQTIQRYLFESEQNINYIQQYSKDINERLNIEIDEKWKQYVPKYDEYYNAFHKQIFYSKENSDESIRQLVLIGVTGTGKSLFGNRLSGYQGHIETNGYFGVSGDVESCTKDISKLIVYNLHAVNISILDTPGIFDTENDDVIHQHNLIKYLQGSGGVNAFILLLKKERLSSFIQNMLFQFEDKFGDQFWSHLIFVVNFWNKRDENGWKEWKNDFIKKIRNDFELNDSEKYPLNIIGVNNFGSYRLQIKRDLIPNIPENRLNCEDFKSPLDRIAFDTSKLYDKIEWLLNDRNDMKQRLNGKCNELIGMVKDLKWFGNKVSDEQVEKMDGFYDIIQTECENIGNQTEMDEIENELKNKGMLDEENGDDLVYLETKSIDYNEFILDKLSYLTNLNSQYVLSCINESMKSWIGNQKLYKAVELLIETYGMETLLEAKQICDTFGEIEKNVMCCNKTVVTKKDMIDNGVRFFQIRNAY
eukprot:446245_1